VLWVSRECFDHHGEALIMGPGRPRQSTNPTILVSLGS